MKLTWKDIEAIVSIADTEIELHTKKELLEMGAERYYSIILKQYEALKKEQLV